MNQMLGVNESSSFKIIATINLKRQTKLKIRDNYKKTNIIDWEIGKIKGFSGKNLINLKKGGLKDSFKL